VPHTLLLADDSVTIQRVIELTFADEDIQVVAVSDGDQAIERLDASPPDIVLADIGMPGKSGYEVAQHVRQTPKLSHIPVVLLTGAFEPVDPARASAAGCDGVLAKPFEPQLVIGRVKDLLAKGRPAAAGGEPVAAPEPEPVVTPAPEPPEPIAQIAAEPVAAAAPPLDDYFDRLDAAFSNLSPTPAPATVSPVEPPAAPLSLVETMATARSEAAPEIDWFSAPPQSATELDTWGAPTQPEPESPTPDLPPAYEPPPPSTPDEEETIAMAPPAAPVPTDHEYFKEFEEFEGPALVESTPPPGSSASAPPVVAAATAAAPLPAVSASIVPSLGDAFAALLAAEQRDQSAVEWPAAVRPPAAPEITDAVVEDIVRRVLDRMSDAIVRETAAEFVSRIAERLVREEIERIKSATK
jgi:CheY-like chemotaxis protein